jgi:hypothetical protein
MKPGLWAKQRFCSISCSKIAENAMQIEGVREKMSRTLRSIGHRPTIRGGNGTGLTAPQSMVMEILGSGWLAEFAVPTKMKRGAGYPTCYKLDIANPSLMTGIELEGQTHYGIRADQDAKKDALLAGFGWRVYRVSNAKAIHACSICKSPDTLLTLLTAS